ncbi:MAG: SagB/ThcOx family dehydrogenase [Nitrospiraceae bacterium]|nr:SagB/ThcOx family dehydrogenase [Nitrospiraceae bacterium]
MSRELPITQPLERPASADPIERVIWYHDRTKHQFNRYARSLGYLDWANQPDPFRRFLGAELVPLPLLQADEKPVSPTYDALSDHTAVPSQAVTIRNLSRFFEFALALSAWKRAGESEWALRSNPSSGNLHPTEGYVVMPSLEGLELSAGLYHYAPKEHALEYRAAFAPKLLARLLAPFPAGAFLFGLTSVHWREAWKYGERAFRYCNHDVGHAIGAARVAASTLGWRMLLLDGVDQNTIARLFGTHRTEDFAEVEPEHPDCVALVWPGKNLTREGSFVKREALREVPLYLDPEVVKDLCEGPWHGKPNRLSHDHAVHWDIIDEAAEASWKTSKEREAVPRESLLPTRAQALHASRTAIDAATIIRQRRSAVAFDGRTSITAEQFFHILERLMPRVERPPLERPTPWDIWPHDPAIHLMLFVHRVEGLRPGLYVLLRDPSKLAFVRQQMNPELEWVPAPGSPEGLPLYWVLEGDAKRLAVQVSCHQDIAGDSAFSLGMLAEFEGRLRSGRPWWYPRLFWEAGLVGQILYLEAEAAGVRGTGIGCFFDDAVHEVVAITSHALQSLYHFTIGGPLEDARLLTLPPYYHVNRER